MALTEKLSSIGDAVRSISGRSEKMTLDGIAQEVRNIYNFTVCGNPQPASPKENTIWVNTDVEITSWAFSATGPENPSEGMVWISVGTSSPVAFNALKKNVIQVYPMSAKQYVSGAWVDKTAQSYQNGAWVAWVPDGSLYLEGNQCTFITGGWKFVRGRGSQYGTGAGVHNEDHMQLTISETWDSIQATTTNKIDLTKYSKLCCRTSGAAGFLQYDSSTTMDNGIAQKAIPKRTSQGNTTLDISSASGSYYVAVQLSSTTTTGTMKVYKVWLE